MPKFIIHSIDLHTIVVRSVGEMIPRTTAEAPTVEGDFWLDNGTVLTATERLTPEEAAALHTLLARVAARTEQAVRDSIRE